MVVPVAAALHRAAVGASILTAALAACGVPTPSSSLEPVAPARPSPALTQVPAAASVPPSLVKIACGTGAPELSGSTITATRDGVRIDVTGHEGWILGYASDTDCASSGDCGSVVLVNDHEVHGLPIRPGVARMTCADPAQVEGPAPFATLRILDPAGWYRPEMEDPSLADCVGLEAPSARRGVDSTPLAQAQALVAGRLQPGDTVERAGWAGDAGKVRVVRDGIVVGRLVFIKDESDSWLLVGASLCGGLTWEAP